VVFFAPPIVMSHETRGPRAAIALLLVAAVAVRLALWTGLVGEDDHFLFALAHDLESGKYRFEAHHQFTRFGILAPLLATGQLTGWHPDAYPAYGFACSIGLILLTYAVGRRWFSPTVGLVAAWVAAFFPNNIHYAGAVHVDVPSSFWFLLGIYSLWPAKPGTPIERPALRGLLAGLCFAAAYLTKEAILLGLAWPAIWFWRDRSSRTRLLFAALGLAAAIGIESATYGILTGNPWHRLEAIRSGAQPEAQTFGGTLIERWLWAYPKLMLVPSGYVGLLYPLLAAALGALWLGRARGWGFLLGWWGVTAALIAWLPGTLSPPTPALSLIPRYLEPLTPPAALLIGLAFERARALRPAACAALALYVAAGVLGAWAIRRDVRAKMDPIRDALTALPRQGDTAIITDPWTAGQVSVLSRFNPGRKTFHFSTGEFDRDSTAKCYYVVYDYGIDYSSSALRYPTPDAGRLNLIRARGRRILDKSWPVPGPLRDGPWAPPRSAARRIEVYQRTW
jgi:4-amino-4-deoxy-L-arabinose transferase-like glycosyltransferase